MNIYLGIDGVLINKDGVLIDDVFYFLKYLTDNHRVYWLTNHCKNGTNNIMEYLQDKMPSKTIELLKKIKLTNWQVSKTEAINFDEDFKWYDNFLSEFDKKILLENNRLRSFSLMKPDCSFKDYKNQENINSLFKEQDSSMWIWERTDLNLSFDEDDFTKITKGFQANKGMDEKWKFIYIDSTLYILRQWSDWVAYKLKFEKYNKHYISIDVQTAFSRLDSDDDDSEKYWNNHHAISILFLIEFYVFKNNLPFLISGEFINKLKVNINGVHGVGHWRRVNKLAQIIAEKNGADKKVAKYFAYIHDIGRQNENTDFKHGIESAKFIINNRSCFELNNNQYNKLIEAVSNHNKDDYKTNDVTIMTCLDADRLDLWRVGVTPDRNFMFTDIGKSDEIVDYSRSLLN